MFTLCSLSCYLIEHCLKSSQKDLDRFPPEVSEHRDLIRLAQYVALSHVLGKQTLRMTILDNSMLHGKHGGLETILADLPSCHAFRDAIDIVRGLGNQHLWIDSLCIIQNSTRFWNLNALVMDLIYGHAELTICAADGKDSAGHFRNVSFLRAVSS